MELFVPDFLQQRLRQRGTEGTDWLAQLPLRVAELERAWGFRVGSAFDHNGVSWVAPVELRDGSPAVLKITFPHEEARFEAWALRAWDGHGAVRLLQASEDGFSLLVERCLPGTNLWSLGVEEGNAIAGQILTQMWREPDPNAPFLALSDYMTKWWNDLPRLTAIAQVAEDVVTEIVARGQELAASQPQNVLLHGDFHPRNVLASQREPWLIIDPKPLVGDPAYDLAQWLYNRAYFMTKSEDAVTALRQQIERFAADLRLDPARISGWAFVKAFGWECGPEYVTLLHKVAQAW